MKRRTYEEVQLIFKEQGCVLLTKDFKNVEQILEYKCPNGHLNSKKFRHFLEGRGCKQCLSMGSRIPYDIVKQTFVDETYLLLSESYKGAHEKLKVMCPIGHITEITWHSFKNHNHRCKKCSVLQYSGSNHYNWNPNKSNAERSLQRTYPGYDEWRKTIWARDNYTCQACYRRGWKLRAHHILNYAEYPHLQQDMNNGITLCLACHNEFHKIYGRKKNTRDQLDEYILAKERVAGLS